MRLLPAEDRHGFDCRVMVSHVQLAVARYPDMERHYQQNLAMRKLYEKGCRRIIAPVLLPRNGDAEVYLIRRRFH